MIKKLTSIWSDLGQSIHEGKRLRDNLLAITIASALSAALGLVMVVINTVQQSGTVVISSWLFFLGGIACAIAAGVFHSRRASIALAVPIIVGIFTYYAVSGSIGGFSIVWALVMPVGISYFFSVKYGILSSVYYELLCAVLFYSPLRERMARYYPEDVMTRYPIVFLTVASVTAVAMVQYHCMALREMEHAKELREQRRSAEAANQAKSSFLASMSHEIRTPINAILGMDEMILREGGEEQILSYADEIQSAGRTLLSIINDILDFSKIEEGKLEILPVQYDVGTVVNDLMNMLRPRAEKKGLRFVVEMDETMPQLLRGDEIRIRQCAMNLLTNAVKYTPDGTVTLAVGYEKLTDDKISLRVRVSDTGIGIKPEDMDRLFIPFERIEAARNRSIEGTGLGMNVTRELLTLMGGRLVASSVYGEGSSFSFTVEQGVVKWEPVGSLADRAEAGAPRRVYRELFHAPDARVLVVDDMPGNLAVIRGLLKRTRVQLVTASSGAEALEIAAQQSFDICLIDHVMPEMDGVETLHELRRLPGCADTPCVVLTANAISGAREQYLGAGFTDYLSKPVDGAKLEKLLLAYLPSEKLELLADEGARAKPPALLPEWLYRIEELDVAAGLRHCGSLETYLDTLTIYAQGVLSAADGLEACRRAQDAAGAASHAHALKSTSRTVGAEALGALAEKLELAGKTNDTQALFDRLDELLPRLRALGKQLAPLRAEQAKAEDDSLPLISAEGLRNAYDSIRELAVNYDGLNATYVLDRLKTYRLPEKEHGRVERLRTAVENFDWDLIEGILDDKIV